MILCITPNPAIDLTMNVNGFSVGTIHRVTESFAAAGGKGINVARAIRIFKGDAPCAGFLAGHTGDYLEQLAEAEGIHGVWTRVRGETRTCVIVADPAQGDATVINGLGPPVGESDWQRLGDDARALAANAAQICVSGSLPPALPENAPPAQFARLLREWVATGRSVWVDSSNAALRAALDVRGINIKVNASELNAAASLSAHSPEEVLAAAQTLRRERRLARIAVTLGAQGAVLVSDAGGWCARPPQLKTISSVGSGDVMLGRLTHALALGMSEAEALREAVAAASANTLSAGGARFTLDEHARVLEQTQLWN